VLHYNVLHYNVLQDRDPTTATNFVQLSFSSDRVMTDKIVQFDTDLLKQRHRYLYRKWWHWL